MILQIITLIILTKTAYATGNFIDDVCDGHHHQKHYWKTEIPDSDDQLAELYRNKCLHDATVKMHLDPSERQYVTYKHKYDTHIHKFKYDEHTIQNTVIDVFHNKEESHRNCQEVEEASCAIPVVDLTDRIHQARGIHPNAFVLSYLLPENCNDCMAKVSLKVDQISKARKTSGRRLSEHPTFTGYAYDGHDNDGVTACNENGIYALDPVENTTVYRDDTGIPIYDIAYDSSKSGDHCRFNVLGGPCTACVLSPNRGGANTVAICSYTANPAIPDLQEITPTLLSTSLWISGRTPETCANACDGLAGVGDDDLCYGFNYNPYQEECYFLVDDGKGICNTYALGGAYYYENPVRMNTIFYSTPPSESLNTLGGGTVSLPEIQFKRIKLNIANDGFPTEHVLKIKIIDPDSTTSESYHSSYVTVFIDADGHGEPHATNPPDHNSGTDHLKVTKINPVMNFDDNIPESVRDQFEIAQLYSDDPDTFGIRYTVDNQFLHFDTTRDDGKNVMAQDVAGNEPERAIYLDGTSWEKLTKNPTRAPTSFPTAAPRMFVRLAEVTTITETNGDPIYYWQIQTVEGDDNSWRSFYYDTPAAGADDSDHASAAWPHIFAPTTNTVLEVSGGQAVSTADNFVGLFDIKTDTNGNVLTMGDGAGNIRHLHIFANDADGTPFSETAYSTWPLVRQDGYPLDLTTNAPTQFPTTAAPTQQCSSGTANVDETDVDCGGGTCPPCANGLACIVNPDCSSASCTDNVCVAPTTAPTTAAPTTATPTTATPTTAAPTTAAPTTAGPTLALCLNGAFDSGVETDLDCGGSCGPTCIIDQTCSYNGDCAPGLSCVTPAFKCKTTTGSPTTEAPTTAAPTTAAPTTATPTTAAPTTSAPTHMPNKIVFQEQYDTQYDSQEFYDILVKSIATVLNITDQNVSVDTAVQEGQGFTVVFQIDSGISIDQTQYFDDIVVEVRSRLSQDDNTAFNLLSFGPIQMNSTLPSGNIQLAQLNTQSPTFPAIPDTFLYSFRHATDDGDLHHQDIWKGSLIVASLVFAVLAVSFCSHFVFSSKKYKKDYEKINQEV